MSTLRLRRFAKILAIPAAITLSVFALQPALASPVSCGNTSLGIRIVTVDPGLVGGYCYATNGNLDLSFPSGLDLISKNGNNSLLAYAQASDGLSGTFSLDGSLWSSYEHLYLGFHFGNAGDTSASNPDSFIVELARANVSGTWALAGTDPDLVKLNALSNIYLFKQGDNVGIPPSEIPEPKTLGLVGLALLAAALKRKS